MNLVIDFRSSVPIYIQIVDQVRAMVESGQLRTGDQLPTVRQMATALRVNFNTVARAYRILDEAGLISTQRGRGTYIWEKPSEETMRTLRQKSLLEITRKYLEEALAEGFSVQEIRQSFEEMFTACQEGRLAQSTENEVSEM